MNRFKVLLLAAVGGVVLLAYAFYLRSTSSSRPATDPPASAPTTDARFLEAARETPRPETLPAPPPVYPPPLRYEDLAPPPPPPPPKRDEAIEALERATALTALRRDAPVPHEPPPASFPGRFPRSSIVAGTLIQAQLHQPLRTDQPATVVAQSLRPVYDLYQRTVVLPAGTRFLGTVAPAQAFDAAVELHWHRLITPDGRSVELAEAAESTDPNGGSVDGRRRTHRGHKAGAVLVTALTSAAVEAARGERATVEIGATAGREAVTGTEALLSRWAQRALSRPPTLHLEAGTTLYIRVLSDLSL